ncbi:MAG TPA: hypothetical protein VE379_06115, partial [Vicinamibacterales bacterium]|nr:hypothetical protein [Vicinamibacterales bacterium]
MSTGVLRLAARAAVAAAVLCAPLLAQGVATLETFDAAWTIVRDKHFDPEMNGVNWNAVRDELRPRAAAARTTGELRGVVREMLGRLGQSHFSLIPGSAETASTAADLSGDAGLDVRLVDGALLVTAVEPEGAAARAGVKPGWKLVTVGGLAVGAALAELPQEPRLRSVEAWRVAHERLRGPAGTTVFVTFQDGIGHLHD